MRLLAALFIAQLLWCDTGEYAGARACAGCHAEIYQKQVVSNHARSMRRPDEVPELIANLPVQFQDRSSGAVLVISKAADAHMELVTNRDKSEEHLPLLWALGSGAKGITPIGRTSAGQYIESRLSWYSANRTFDLTTGATTHDAHTLTESLGRMLTSAQTLECLGCHTTRPAQPDSGIGCERCHGPGIEHIRAMQSSKPGDRKIIQPRSFSAFRMAELCGDCHGHPPQDNDFARLRQIERTPGTSRFPSQRLVLSRCFNESAYGLKCTLCHDPHGNVAPAEDRPCVGCHAKDASAAVCPKARSACVSCHMPKRQVMAHSLFTDHWIRIVSDRE